MVDLRREPKIVARVPLSLNQPANHLALLPGGGMAVLSSGRDLLLIDLKKQQVATTLNLPDRINALDIDQDKHRAVLAVGGASHWSISTSRRRRKSFRSPRRARRRPGRRASPAPVEPCW